MFDESMIIAGSAASIGFVHTILGPDHYLPLVAMAKTNGWSATKTASYVAVCGVSHLLGTILIGSLVFLLGFAFLNIETVQALRGRFCRLVTHFVRLGLFCLGRELGHPA